MAAMILAAAAYAYFSYGFPTPLAEGGDRTT